MAESHFSLRRRLLLWLVLPLFVIWLFSAWWAYQISVQFTNDAYDRSLLNTAMTLSKQIGVSRGVIVANLPRMTLDVLNEDQYDRMYYMISRPNGNLVAGYAGLPLPTVLPNANHHVFFNGRYNGIPVRVVAMAIAPDRYHPQRRVMVELAETLVKRQLMGREILSGLIVPRLASIALTLLLVWYAVSRGLKPLRRLQEEVASRSPRDLEPLNTSDTPDEVVSLVEEFNRLLIEIKQVLAARQRFIADAAHQLRTPLAGLKTQTELALRETDPKELQEVLQLLHHSGERSVHLVNQLLSLARAEPREGKTPFKLLDLLSLSRQVTAEWVPKALDCDLDLGFETTIENEAFVNGNEILLREMMANLIDNAIRYTPSAGRVTVRIDSDEKAWLIQVEDNGPGIPPEERTRVFDRFYSILGSNRGGSGLGLAIVQEIAQMHAATIELVSLPVFYGTRVNIRIPRSEMKG
ncbi:MAG TPA: sensor histidine kinase N-terminal domain-containing protein [Burkholderiales bacterium]|nr:sensor histidine kinase N-terminal domain-containing protein [Burkholderiales bacterium]